jgi:hypothetical protein
MRERKTRVGGTRAWERQGRQGHRARVGPSWARPDCAGLGRVAGQNPTTRRTTDWNPNAKRKPKRD